MESAAGFRYEQADRSGDLESGGRSSSSSFLLDIYVHHARNICIYADQDVYARFALTSAPDHAPPLSTRVAASRGGAADPRFDERLPPLRVRGGRIGTDVLKCEIWKRSCAEKVMAEDQLLGFALVPLAAVAGAEGARLAARDFSLSSTDLFHSPARTIRLSLALHAGPPDASTPPERAAETSITSEVVILEAPAPTVDYSRVEFPDLNVVKENHDMAVQYLPFLHLREAARPPPEDCEMGTSPRGDNPVSSDGSKNGASTTTTFSDSDDRVVVSISSLEPAEKPPLLPGAADEATTPMSCRRSPDTPTSSSEGKAGKEKDVFKSPLGDIDMEAEHSAMQRQIMEMYVKSMQQFTESLGKMKLPMELDGVVVVHTDEKPETEAKKKDVPRVFYGSRAFF